MDLQAVDLVSCACCSTSSPCSTQVKSSLLRNHILTESPCTAQVDRSHIPESSMRIYSILSEQLQRVKQTIPAQQRRMADDLERRINSLFDALNCDTLSKSVLDQLNELTKAMEAHDREAALSIHVDLLTRGSQTDDIGLWMSSVKQLIMRL
ncbi:hypothetical protein EDD15DRAFT_2259342 [Pisolithus albus]|nr:hypothetical protein EDD15DRAFT_2259342 [Pisolithus albus]